MISTIPIETEQAFRNFVNLSDNNIRTAARMEVNQKYRDSKARKLGSIALVSVPFIHTLAEGVLAKNVKKVAEDKVKVSAASLAKKLGTATKTAGAWIGGLALLGVLGGINNVLTTKKVKTDDGQKVTKLNALGRFRENHGGLTLFSDIAIFAGSFLGAAEGLKKLGKHLAPKKIGQWAIENTNNLKTFINGSLAARVSTKHITPFVNNTLSKIKMTNVAPKILKNAAFGLIGIGLLGKLIAIGKSNKVEEEAYQNLKDTQLLTAQTLLEHSDKLNY